MRQPLAWTDWLVPRRRHLYYGGLIARSGRQNLELNSERKVGLGARVRSVAGGWSAVCRVAAAQDVAATVRGTEQRRRWATVRVDDAGRIDLVAEGRHYCRGI